MPTSSSFPLTKATLGKRLSIQIINTLQQPLLEQNMEEDRRSISTTNLEHVDHPSEIDHKIENPGDEDLGAGVQRQGSSSSQASNSIETQQRQTEIGRRQSLIINDQAHAHVAPHPPNTGVDRDFDGSTNRRPTTPQPHVLRASTDATSTHEVDPVQQNQETPMGDPGQSQEITDANEVNSILEGSQRANNSTPPPPYEPPPSRGRSSFRGQNMRGGHHPRGGQNLRGGRHRLLGDPRLTQPVRGPVGADDYQNFDPQGRRERQER